ncbi:MAG: cation transporter [Halothiobacillus sp. 24-54-40]|jgi:Co/Zn/Cd efflux system component|nr:MAG: cation transporter [Halothiobacillus sp. 35-54-62]OYZ87265.1 MAG: cation transporter [Halothiobacillus sp. 24-54-40]OZA79013.1 MAG: cation transporter [Halothiobacillus sp. 39-53-45]
MAGCCHSGGCSVAPAASPRYRKALWIALWVNAAMFLVELVGGLQADSVSLLADSVDFASDAANYGISLAVLSMGLALRSKAAWVKGASMLGFGVFIAGHACWSAAYGGTPEPIVMGVVAILALISNAGVAWMLYTFRDGDANMRSVWLCSRNDAIGNIAVLLAAFGVFGTDSRWPDLGVALIMASLAIWAGLSITRQAREELRALSGRAPAG